MGCYIDTPLELWGLLVMAAVVGWFLGYLPSDKGKPDA